MDTSHLLKYITVLKAKLLKVVSEWFEAVVNIFFICVTSYRKI